MADTTGATTPVTKSRPIWLPDTPGFLAIAIVVLVFFIIVVLLMKDTFNPSQQVFGALLTMLGVITGTFKDVYGWAFGSSQKEAKKDDAMTALATAPAAPTPAAPTTLWWSQLTEAEKNAISAAATTDPRVQAISAAMTAGAANQDDLAYLVTKLLLTPDRAHAIAAS